VKASPPSTSTEFQPVRESEDRRPRLLLDLDGFEPDQGSLARFAGYLHRKLTGTETESEKIYRAAETVERIHGCNSWSAALVCLGLQRAGALAGLAAALESAEQDFAIEPSGGAREALREMLQGAAGEAGLAISIVDARELAVTFLQELAETFPSGGSIAVELEEPSRDLRTLTLEVRADPQLGRLLRLIAFCGDCAPVDLLLDFLGASPVERDNLLDALDHSVEIAGVGAIFQDHEYRHPSFPRNLVYGFRDRAVQAALARGVPDAEREGSCRSLYLYFSELFTAASRGTEKLLQRLARGFPGGLEADLHDRILSWWVTRDEVGALKARLAADLRGGALPAETLWSAIERVVESWPAFRCFALLDVHAEALAGAPAGQRGAHHLLRAVLRRREMRLPEAYEEARLACGFYDQDTSRPRDAAQAHALAARTASELSRPEVARRHWERALQILEGSHGETSEVSSLRRNLADLAAAAGDFPTAMEHQARALRIEERLFGPDDSRIAQVLRILSGFAAKAGEMARARTHLERALEIDAGTLGDVHEQVSEDCRMLADLLWRSDDRPAARQVQERAIEIEARLRGENHPHIGSGLKLLAQWAWQMDEAGAARRYLERALGIEKALSGERGLETGRVHQALEVLCAKLGDEEAARHHGERAREIGVSPSPAP
jgi:tetratricopeptide (TPR) repeat protein